MTPEEFQRIKEAEKEHLRALKKLKEQLRAAQRLQTVNRALREMQDAPGEDLERTHEEMIERLAMDTVRQEVQLDMAISEASAKTTEESAGPTAASEVELEKLRAQSLIRQIKIEMGLETPPQKQDPAPNVATARRDVEAEGGAPPAHPTPTPRTGPEKTIGRLRK
jgi:hypothetical protein